MKTPGRGYVLSVGGDASHPFAIADDLYAHLQYDALAYFFHNRSGMAIELPYARDEKWARPAGHVGDRSVGCAPLRAGGPPACAYKLDASGGWYDAGDQGKYVVNGGIAVWTLMNEWESAQARGAARTFADGTMSLPERRNGAPDLLDEARWELEFLLRMQVPEGQPLAGMVHHKLHDKDWTALGLAPHEDKQERLLFPPSTAATLNLAATAAQGARLWRPFDPKFAARCLAAAEKAWAAAAAHPTEYAASGGVGGGPYDDRDVSDERYWAAAELFVTTKKAVYEEALRASPHFAKVPTTVGGDGVPTSMTWDHVQALGTISLALAKDALPAADVAACRGAVRAAADRYAALMRGQGLSRALRARRQGLPVGLELVRAQQRRHPGPRLRLLRRRAPPRRRRRGDELPPRPQPARSVVRHGLRRAPARAPAPPLLGAPGQREVSAARRPASSRAAPTPACRIPTPRPPGSPAARPRRASSTTSRPGRSTRSRSTGTRRWPGSPRSSTSARADQPTARFMNARRPRRQKTSGDHRERAEHRRQRHVRQVGDEHAAQALGDVRQRVDEDDVLDDGHDVEAAPRVVRAAEHDHGRDDDAEEQADLLRGDDAAEVEAHHAERDGAEHRDERRSRRRATSRGRRSAP